MSFRVLFGPDASAELAEAARWYERRRPGLGARFVAAVDVALEPARPWPSSGALVTKFGGGLRLRGLRVGRFPYLVADNAIHVLAVAHDRRRPGYWAPRAEP